MTILEIQKLSGLKLEVATSLFYHCLWLRDAKPDEKVMWRKLLWDKKYRLGKENNAERRVR